MSTNLTENLAFIMNEAMPNLRFEAHLTDEPECEDHEIKIFRGEEELPITIQCGWDYAVLNEYGYDRPGDTSSLWMRQLGEGSYIDPVYFVNRIGEYLA